MTTKPKPPCTRVLWRGVVVCSHTVPKLNAWATSVGVGILLTPLAGCGSYQTSTTASAGTHAGGGAIDIDLRAVPSTQRMWVADKGRTSGLQVAWHRNAISGLWTWHCHALDPDCPQLAKVAAAQCVEMFNGGDGLVGTTPDGNTRTNVPQLKSIFSNRAVMQVVEAVATVAQATLAAPKVKAMQAALHLKPVDGVWGPVTERQAWLTKTTAMQGRAFFAKRPLAERKAIQAHVGATQDGVWGPKTQAAIKATVKVIQAKAFALGADGVWGPVTDTAYYALRRRAYRP